MGLGWEVPWFDGGNAAAAETVTAFLLHLWICRHLRHYCSSSQQGKSLETHPQPQLQSSHLVNPTPLQFHARNDVVIYAVATALGTLPVTLILVLTITMAAGTKVMVQRNVVVRNMRSLEALG